MSFSIPAHVPNLSSAMRDAENSLWSAAKRSSSDKELPLYKDKPYGSNHKRNQKRRKILLLLAIAGAIFYMIYNFGRAESSTSSSSSTPSSMLNFLNRKKKVNWKDRQNQVKQAFKDSWAGYEKYAWGKDVYKPVTKTGANMGPKPLGWIIVDSLDTLKIMGFDEELHKARNWVRNELNYDMDYNVNTFETTIRMLGGLLSAHYLTHDDLYLDKATDLANRLIGAFDTPSGIPYASVNLHTSKGVPAHTLGGASSTAEVATLQLELKYLSKLTGETLYWEKAEQVMSALDKNHPQDGLVPIFVDPVTGKYQGNNIRIGSRGDSYYEYLLKQFLQTESKEYVYKSMYQEAVAGIKKHLVAKSEPHKLTFIGELPSGIGGPFSPKMDHLVCFAGGMLALGATQGLPISIARHRSWTSLQEDDFQLAMELTKTCYELYAQSPSGLASEIVYFHTEPSSQKDFYVKRLDQHNLQRPETVESLFVLYRLTKNEIYREWGWEIFKAFQEHAKIQDSDAGYTSLNHVNTESPTYRDNMESFWLSETLKYLYLLFEDDTDILSLTDVVFNTEGHPFPKFSMGSVFKTGWERTLDQEESTGDGAEAKKQIIQTEKVTVSDKAAAPSQPANNEGNEVKDDDSAASALNEAKKAIENQEKKEQKPDGSN